MKTALAVRDPVDYNQRQNVASVGAAVTGRGVHPVYIRTYIYFVLIILLLLLLCPEADRT